MELLVTGEQMKALDHFTIQEMGVPSLVLMERAGLAVFEAMKKKNFLWTGRWYCAEGEITAQTVW